MAPFGHYGRRQAAWQAAAPIPGVDPDFARLDALGSEIHWHQYRRRGCIYGWEIATGIGSEGDGPRAVHWCNAATRLHLPTETPHAGSPAAQSPAAQSPAAKSPAAKNPAAAHS